MNKLTQKFTISELQSILTYLQNGDSISTLISEIENPESNLINPASRGKFRNLLPRLRAISAEEEQTLKTFSNLYMKGVDADPLIALQPFYTESKSK